MLQPLRRLLLLLSARMTHSLPVHLKNTGTGATAGLVFLGDVLMIRNVSTYNASGDPLLRWIVLAPEGQLSTVGDPCEGLVAALAHATDFGYDLRVLGGTLAHNGPHDGSRDRAVINCGANNPSPPRRHLCDQSDKTLCFLLGSSNI